MKSKLIIICILLPLMAALASGCLDKAKIQSMYQPAINQDVAEQTDGDADADADAEEEPDKTDDTGESMTVTKQDLDMINSLKTSEDQIEILGSPLSLPFLEATADVLKKSGLDIDVTAVGNTAAVDAVDKGGADAAVLHMQPDKLKDQSRAKVLTQDGAVLIVNKQSKIKSMTEDEITALFTSDEEDEDDGDGENADPQASTDAGLPTNIVIGGEKGHAWQMFGSLMPIKQQDGGISRLVTPSSANVVENDAAVIAAVEKDPQAIGVVNMHDDLKAVTVLNIEGKKPQEGDYPAKLPLLLYFKDSSSSLVKVLTDFYGSGQGQGILSGNFTPVE